MYNKCVFINNTFIINIYTQIYINNAVQNIYIIYIYIYICVYTYSSMINLYILITPPYIH